MPDLNEQMRASLIEGLKSLLEGRGCGFRGQFADEAYGDAADALIACLPEAARRQHGSAAQAVGEVVLDYIGGGQSRRTVRWFGSPPKSGAKLYLTAPPVADAEGVKDALRLIHTLDGIAMRLCADLANMEAKTIKERDYLSRESVMQRVMQWRDQWDKTAPDRNAITALSRRPAAEPCTYPNCVCIGGGVFKPCVRPAAAPGATPGGNGAAEQPAAEPELLPLPGATWLGIKGLNNNSSVFGYTADQMHAYARAHLSARSLQQITDSGEQQSLSVIGAGQGSKDSERLDWLEANCTGASNSERYLPFRVYWGNKGATKGIRAQLDKAMAAAKGEQA